MGSALGGREPASLFVKWRQEYGALSRLDKVMWHALQMLQNYATTSLEDTYLLIESNIKREQVIAYVM